MNRLRKNAPYLIFLFLLASHLLQASEKMKSLNVYEEIVESWNRAHNDWRFEELKKLYASKVLFYTKWQTRDFCVSNKFSQVSPKEKFQHKIEGPIKIKTLAENLILCSFIKTVYRGGSLKEYPAYLVLQQMDNNWRIVAESDAITDKNRHFALSASAFDPKSNPSRRQPKDAGGDDSTGILLVVVILTGILIIVFLLFRRRRAVTQTKDIQTAIKPVLSDAAVNQTPKPTNKEVGTAFEDYIITKFDQHYFKLLERTNDTVVGGVYAKSRSNPDFLCQFELRKYSKKFAVECTYRNELSSVITVKLAEQLDRYTKFGEERNVDVYIVLGLGGAADNPKEVFIIPVKNARPKMTYDEIKMYKRRNMKRFFFDRSVEVLT